MWERDTLHLFHFEYSCASLIPVEYSCLAAIFAVSSKFLYVSCVELSVFLLKKELSCFTYICLESDLNKFIGVWLDQKMCYTCGSGIKCLHESL